MGTIRRLAPAAGDVTLGQAADAYLATLRGAEHASTRRTYGRILRWIVTEFGSDTAPDIDPERFTAWFTAQWASRAPSTWNVSLDAIRSAAAWWMQQGWITADPSRMLKRRKPRPDRTRALSRAEVEQLLTRQDISLRERTFWRMAYKTGSDQERVIAPSMPVGALKQYRGPCCRSTPGCASAKLSPSTPPTCTYRPAKAPCASAARAPPYAACPSTPSYAPACTSGSRNDPAGPAPPPVPRRCSTAAAGGCRSAVPATSSAPSPTAPTSTTSTSPPTSAGTPSPPPSFRGGTDLVAVADMLGHARLDTVCLYTHPSAVDRERALNLLPHDR